MEDELRGRTASNTAPTRVGIGHVDHLEPRAGLQRRLQVGPLAGRQVVDDGHPIAAFDKLIDEVRADEAGAPSDNAVHDGREGYDPARAGVPPAGASF